MFAKNIFQGGERFALGPPYAKKCDYINELIN